MPTSLCGTWDMVSNVNFESYMIAPGISPCLRKIALKLKQRKVIEQQGDQYTLKTLSRFQNYTVSFRVGEEFEEFTQGLDNRHVKSLVSWEGNKLVCEQRTDVVGLTGLKTANHTWSCPVKGKSASRFLRRM